MASPRIGWARRVTWNSVPLLVARVIAASATLLTVPVLYDELGSRVYGVWALLSGVAAITALSDLGLGSAQIRSVALAVGGGDQRHARAALALGRLGCAAMAVLAMVVAVICWPWLTDLFTLQGLDDQALVAALLLLSGLVLDSIGTPSRAVLEGTQRYVPVGVVTACAAVLGAALSVLAVFTSRGLVLLAAAAMLTSGARAAMFLIAARRHAGSLVPCLSDIRRSDMRSVLGYGGPMQLSNMASAINNETDRLVLGGLLTAPVVAHFDLGSKLANVLRLVPSFFLTPLFPEAGTVAATPGSAQLDRLYALVTRNLAAFAAVGAAALVVSADPLVRMWLGHTVPLAVTTIQILVPGYAVNIVSGVAAVVTRAEGRPGRETRYAMLAAALNLVLTIPLLRLLGPWGVPLSTTVALCVSTTYFFAHFHRSSGRPIAPLVRALWQPVVAGVTAGLLTALAEPSLPDGMGRLAAAFAVLCRGGLAIVVGIAVLAALGFFRNTTTDDRSRR